MIRFYIAIMVEEFEVEKLKYAWRKQRQKPKYMSEPMKAI